MTSITHSEPTAEEILSRTTISQVWIALGGDPPKGSRAKAFWRKSRDPNVSVNDTKNCWFDFRDGIGGGVFDLIQRIRGGSRQDALKWLADYLGVPLDRPQWTEAERREWGRRRRVAEAEARVLVTRKHELLAALRAARDSYLQGYHRARRYIRDHGAGCAECVALAADVAETYEARYQEFDRRIDLLARARFADLLPLFRPSREKRAA